MCEYSQYNNIFNAMPTVSLNTVVGVLHLVQANITFQTFSACKVHADMHMHFPPERGSEVCTGLPVVMYWYRNKERSRKN